MKKSALIYKHIGETPLEALERFRAEQVAAGHTEYAQVPMTYAGRLDPMAEGELLILIGDECKNKARYLGLDKEYEVEIVFGIETDTYDALGMARPGSERVVDSTKNSYDLPPWSGVHAQLKRYVGKFVQEYPPYSSRTVNGRQLHELARVGELPTPEEMPTKEVEIYSVELLENGAAAIPASVLKARIFGMIEKVSGDFRQEEIKARWNEVLGATDGVSHAFSIIKIRVKCSSGTYMRSLAHRMGKEMGAGAFALTIKRTKIFI